MTTTKLGISSLLFASLVSAEVHSLTLQQALELAARQNPEVALARLDEQRAEQGVKVALDPFRPKGIWRQRARLYLRLSKQH